MKRVLIVFPTAWDRRQLEACRHAWADRYQITYGSPDDEQTRASFDVLDYIERTVEIEGGRLDGVMSSSDYPGTVVAAAIADGLGLPGPSPLSVIRSSHKYYARLASNSVIPEATPSFALLDPRGGEDSAKRAPRFPCFVKPVKGAFSQLARRVESMNELVAYLQASKMREYLEDYLRLFNVLLTSLTSLEYDGRYILAEEILRGDQVTVEGYVSESGVSLIGIVDSVMHPGTRSFRRFDCPSRLPETVQARMRELARRLVEALGLRQTLFNIEMTYDAETGKLGVIEVNPRICGQFADLYEKTTGVNSYLIALALACGEEPPIDFPRSRFKVAASYPLRVFETSRVGHVPGQAKIRAIETSNPGTLIWVDVETDQILECSPWSEDGASVRYAVLNAGAEDSESLQAHLEAVEQSLAIEVTPATHANELNERP